MLQKPSSFHGVVVLSLLIFNGVGCIPLVEQESDEAVLIQREYTFVHSADSLPALGDREFVHSSILGSMRGIDLRGEYQDTVAQIIADTLILRISHAAGCQDHEFKLFVAPSPASSGVAIAALRYRATPWEGQVICYALAIRWLRFSLDGLREDLGVNGTILIEGALEAQSGSSGTYVPFSLTY
jgi:hypothetical protein